MESSIAPPIPKTATPMTSAPEERTADAEQDQHEVNTTADLVAGWLGGAVGVIAGNPFEVLKVRLQTAQTHAAPSPSGSSSTFPNSPRVGKSSTSPIMLSKPTSPPAQATISSPNRHDTTTLRTTASSVQIPATSSSRPTPASSSAPAPPPSGSTPRREKPSIMSLYRSEGIRFFFAGAAGPILGLAFIDSAFFGLYGRVMQKFGQDRQDPNALPRVFLAGATAGAACALLETPIEVVKTRAQVESSGSSPGGKLGSFRIASMIAKKEGLRGFYVGGLMTSIHDGISSGIFFATYFVFRRLLRGEHPFHQGGVPIPTTTTTGASNSVLDAPEAASTHPGMGKGEVARILLAGGLAGALSALIPYPFDIVKTRLQTANFESKAPRSSASSPTPASTVPSFTSTVSSSVAQKRLTIPSVFSQIYRDSIQSHRYRYRSTLPYSIFSSMFPPKTGDGSYLVDGRPGPNPKAEKWTMRVLGLRGFGVGLRPTVVSSFVGSAATITTVEVALHLMGVNGGGGVG